MPLKPFAFVLAGLRAYAGAHLCRILAETAGFFVVALQRIAEAGIGEALALPEPAPPKPADAPAKSSEKSSGRSSSPAPGPRPALYPSAQQIGGAFGAPDLFSFASLPDVRAVSGRVLLQLISDASFVRLYSLPRLYERHRGILTRNPDKSGDALKASFDHVTALLSSLETGLLQAYMRRSARRVEQECHAYLARLPHLVGSPSLGPKGVSGPLETLVLWLVGTHAEVAAEAPVSAEAVMFHVVTEMSAKLAAGAAQMLGGAGAGRRSSNGGGESPVVYNGVPIPSLPTFARPPPLGLFAYCQARLDFDYLERILGAFVTPETAANLDTLRRALAPHVHVSDVDRRALGLPPGPGPVPNLPALLHRAYEKFKEGVLNRELMRSRALDDCFAPRQVSQEQEQYLRQRAEAKRAEGREMAEQAQQAFMDSLSTEAARKAAQEDGAFFSIHIVFFCFFPLFFLLVLLLLLYTSFYP